MGSLSKPVPGADGMVTPLKWEAWESELAEHHDREWVGFLVRGIWHGFRLGPRAVGSKFEMVRPKKPHPLIINMYF